jgi:hypothetical protein
MAVIAGITNEDVAVLLAEVCITHSLIYFPFWLCPTHYVTKMNYKSWKQKTVSAPKAGERLSLRSVKAATERCNGRLATEVLQ